LVNYTFTANNYYISVSGTKTRPCAEEPAPPHGISLKLACDTIGVSRKGTWETKLKKAGVPALNDTL
jgi:hypothetical protein